MTTEEATNTRSASELAGQRPWTVWVLVASSLVGFVFSLVSNGFSGLATIISLAVGAALTYGLWFGVRAAFTISFVLTCLCFVMVALVSIVSLGAGNFGEIWASVTWSAAWSLTWIFLLRHPATKRFAGLADRSEIPEPAGDQSRL